MVAGALFCITLGTIRHLCCWGRPGGRRVHSSRCQPSRQAQRLAL